MDTILSWKPSLADYTWLDRSSLTVFDDRGNGICLLDYDSDQPLPLPGKQESLSAANRLKAYDAAWTTYVIKQVAVGTIFASYGFHLIGIDLPFIGGEPGAGSWGVLSGMCLQLGPIMPVLALVHTIAKGNPFIGTCGLFTRGAVCAGLSILVIEFWTSLARHHLSECLKEWKSLDKAYEEIYQKEATKLQEELKKGLQGGDMSNLKKRAKQIQQKEEELKKVFGFNIRLFRSHLSALYLRIHDFNPSEADQEKMEQIATRFILNKAQKTTADTIPVNYAQQKAILNKKLTQSKGQAPQDPASSVQKPFWDMQYKIETRFEYVTKRCQEKQDIGVELDTLSMQLSTNSLKEANSNSPPLIKRQEEENNFIERAAYAESHFSKVVPSEKLEELAKEHKAKKTKYQELEPAPINVVRAYVIATFLQDDNGWEETKEKLKNLEESLCDPRTFVKWVEARALPERKDEDASINLKAHNTWDHFRAITRIT